MFYIMAALILFTIFDIRFQIGRYRIWKEAYQFELHVTKLRKDRFWR